MKSAHPAFELHIDEKVAHTSAKNHDHVTVGEVSGRTILRCSHCLNPIDKSERCIKEAPFAYHDKSLRLLFHRQCFMQRTEVELDMAQVHNEYLSICEALRAAKAAARLPKDTMMKSEGGEREKSEECTGKEHISFGYNLSGEKPRNAGKEDTYKQKVPVYPPPTLPNRTDFKVSVDRLPPTSPISNPKKSNRATGGRESGRINLIHNRRSSPDISEMSRSLHSERVLLSSDDSSTPFGRLEISSRRSLSRRRACSPSRSRSRSHSRSHRVSKIFFHKGVDYDSSDSEDSFQKYAAIKSIRGQTFSHGRNIGRSSNATSSLEQQLPQVIRSTKKASGSDLVPRRSIGESLSESIKLDRSDESQRSIRSQSSRSRSAVSTQTKDSKGSTIAFEIGETREITTAKALLPISFKTSSAPVII